MVGNLVDALQKDNADLDGLTISGGEPLQQPESLAALIRCWRQHGAGSVVVFSGFSWREIQGHPLRKNAVAQADVVIAGRYNASQHLGTGLRGSRNKEYHFLTPVYSELDFLDLPEIEILIDESGALTWTGMEPPHSHW